MRRPAGEYLNKAIAAGSQNAANSAPLRARMEKDLDKARAALAKAVQAGPNSRRSPPCDPSAAPHGFGPDQRTPGRRQTGTLQNMEYQADLARAPTSPPNNLRSPPEPGWPPKQPPPTTQIGSGCSRSASRSTPQRLDAEEAERRRQQEEDRRDVERVKAAEIARVSALPKARGQRHSARCRDRRQSRALVGRTQSSQSRRRHFAPGRLPGYPVAPCHFYQGKENRSLAACRCV